MKNNLLVISLAEKKKMFGALFLATRGRFQPGSSLVAIGAIVLTHSMWLIYTATHYFIVLHKNTLKLTLLTDPLGTLHTTLKNNTNLVSMCLMVLAIKQIELSIFQSFKHYFCLRQERGCSITVVQIETCISFTECKVILKDYNKCSWQTSDVYLL